MPRIELKFRFAEDIGEDKVKRAFISEHGGTERNWRWLKDTLAGADPRALKEQRVALDGFDVLELPPCLVIGWLRIKNEEAWRRGWEKSAYFLIAAVVHESVAAEYMDREAARLKEMGEDVL